jgi:hypothetical protein
VRPGAQETLVTTGGIARAWMRFIVSPAPGAALPATSPAGLVVVMLALATPLALLVAALLQPVADWAGIESSVEFRLTWTEALMVLGVAPVVEEAVFRWPLGSRRTFERALLWLPLALVAIAACTLLAGLPRPLSIIVVAATLAGTALLGLQLDDLLERRRFTGIEPARTLFTRRYALLAQGLTLAFALTHGLNYEFDGRSLPLLPALVLPQWIVGYACLFVRVRAGLGAAVALHAAHNAIAYGLVAAGA